MRCCGCWCMLMPVEREALSPVVAWIAALTMMIGASARSPSPTCGGCWASVVIAGIGIMMAGLAIGGYGGDRRRDLLRAAFHAADDGALSRRRRGRRRHRRHFSLRTRRALWRRHPACRAVDRSCCLPPRGLPPFSGFWPKAHAGQGRASLAARWWLAARRAASPGFLTTLAGGRLVLFALWRAGPRATARRRRLTPRRSPCPGRSRPPRAGAAPRPAGGGDRPRPAPVIISRPAAAAGLVDPSAFIDAVFGGCAMSSRFVVVLLFVAMWAAVTGSISGPHLCCSASSSACVIRCLLRDQARRRPAQRTLRILSARLALPGRAG